MPQIILKESTAHLGLALESLFKKLAGSRLETS